MDEKKVDLGNMSIPQLEEVRDRQLLLLKNKHIVNKLADKGEQAKKFLEKVELVIDEKKAVLRLEQQMENLNMNTDGCESSQVDYVEHVCRMEKNNKDERFKPFRIMSPKKTSKPEEMPKPTQLLPLRDSVELQVKQVAKAEEERIRFQYRQRPQEISGDSDTEDSSEEGINAESSCDEEEK